MQQLTPEDLRGMMRYERGHRDAVLARTNANHARGYHHNHGSKS